MVLALEQGASRVEGIGMNFGREITTLGYHVCAFRFVGGGYMILGL